MNTNTALQNLGLTEKESMVYTALLGLGKTNVSQIAKVSSLKRPTIYVLLEELRKKELVLKIPYAKKAIFIAKDPDIFFRDSLIRAQEAYGTLTQLKAMQKKDNKVSTMYFEGDEGIKEAMYYRHEDLKNTEIVGFFAKANTLHTKFINMSDKWRKKMNENGIKVRGISPTHNSLDIFRETDSELGQIIKQVPIKDYSSDVSIDATDLFVRIILFDVNQAIIIENPAIVKTLKEIFEMSWKGIN